MVANKFNILSSFLRKFILPLDILFTKSFFSSSISGLSIYTTSPNNYSSKPYSVTVKLITVTLINISGKNYGLANLVLKNNLKLGSNSTSLSPIFIILRLFTTLNYFNNNGSKKLSNYSYTSSNNNGIPVYTAFSICFIKPSYVILNTLRFKSLYVFLTHVFAYNYGSINIGYDLLYFYIIPFDFDTVSLGKPFAAHDYISNASPKTFSKLYFSSNGIYNSIALSIQFYTNYYLNIPVNGPKYATVEPPKNTLPNNNCISSANDSTFNFHLSYSSAKPTVNSSALTNLYDVVYIS